MYESTKTGCKVKDVPQQAYRCFFSISFCVGTCDFISIPKHKKEQKQLKPWRTFGFEK